MKHPKRFPGFLTGFLLPAALLVGLGLGGEPAGSGDGIRVNEFFAVPFQSADAATKARAYVQADGSMVVDYISKGEILRVTYKIARQDSPVPGPTPGPVPGPTPKPPDPPGPDTKANFVYVIREGQLPKPDLAFAAIDNDKGWRDLADSLKVGWKVYDQDNAVFKTMPNPLTTARTVGLPAAVFVFPDGTSKGEPLKDKKPTDLSGLIKKYGGGK